MRTSTRVVASATQLASHAGRARWGISNETITVLKRVRQAHAAYVEYKELRDTESQAFAHERQLERCEEVKAAWVEHQLDDADQLCVPVPPRIAKKYPATTGYILGTTATTTNLDGVIAARLEMRDKKRSSELVSLTLEDLKRDPRQSHVFICPCGYVCRGKSKMIRSPQVESVEGRARPHSRHIQRILDVLDIHIRPTRHTETYYFHNRILITEN